MRAHDTVLDEILLRKPLFDILQDMEEMSTL